MNKCAWLISLAICCLLSIANADDAKNKIEQISQAAEVSFAQKNWQDAISLYEKIVQLESNHAQAWYRIAQANLRLKFGKQAFQANQQVVASIQIPNSAILYQKAQALSLMGKNKEMWKALEEAVAAGYRGISDIEINPIWAGIKSENQYTEIKKMIDKNIHPCMYDDQYRQFDFWLGEWEVYGNIEKTGPLFGHNNISRMEQGCLIIEQWKGSSGSTGTSMNYYDGIVEQWVQRWVSKDGTVIDYSGGLINQEGGQRPMQLVGKIYYASTQPPEVRDFKGTWTLLDDGVVQQLFEESIDGGQTWYVWFNGFYFPVGETVANEN